MLTEKWNYTNEIIECVEYDTFYCDLLNRIVDLGYSGYGSTVSTWVCKLNNINYKLYKNKTPTDTIKMNNITAGLIQLEYDTDNKFGSYHIEIIDNINNNEIQLISNKNIVGKLFVI